MCGRSESTDPIDRRLIAPNPEIMSVGSGAFLCHLPRYFMVSAMGPRGGVLMAFPEPRKRLPGSLTRSIASLPLTHQVVSKRFVKTQQMQWTPRGAHLLLQTRTTVVNNDLEDAFRRWYPRFRAQANCPRSLDSLPAGARSSARPPGDPTP